MKKLTTVLSVIMALVLMVSTLPMAWALEPVQHPSFNYDNSFWVTLQTEEACSVEQLQTLLKVETCYIMDKQTKEGKITYQLVAMNGEEPVEADIERVKTLPGVMESGRNVYASDYEEKSSYITLNQTTIEIPVGGTATLKVTDAKLVQSSDASAGVLVEVDHEVLPFERFFEMVTGMGDEEQMSDVFPIALYETDKIFGEDGLHIQVEDGDWWSLIDNSKVERLNTQSPIGKYVIESIDEHLVPYPHLVQVLAQTQGISTARIAYAPSYSGIAPHEKWSVEDTSIAGVAIHGGDEFNRFYNVTVVGRTVGQTVITVQHGGGSQICYATCTVTVVEADPESPTDVVFGDLTGDRKADAKDALEVLKYAVQKAEFTPLQMLAAEVDGIEGIGARDALEILKYTVKKIDKFPIQQGVETPTDVTPTNR